MASSINTQKRTWSISGPSDWPHAWSIIHIFSCPDWINLFFCRLQDENILAYLLRYLSLDIICYSKLTVVLELRSRKTVRFTEQIMSADKYPSIFSRQMVTIVYLVYTETVDSVEGALWLGSQTPNILCYLPPSNSGENDIPVRIREKWKKSSKLSYPKSKVPFHNLIINPGTFIIHILFERSKARSSRCCGLPLPTRYRPGWTS